MLKAIETRYKGYRFRSRLEARWAVFFDALGITWEYEKEGYDLGASGWYLPDFWLPEVYDRHGLKGVWVEIKGQESTEKEQLLCEQLAIDTKHSTNIFSGLPDQHDGFGGEQWTYFKYTEDEPPDFKTGDEAGFYDGGMVFHYCEQCRVAKIEFSNDYYSCFKCGQQTCTQWNDKLYAACKAARSARFEHGEQP